MDQTRPVTRWAIAGLISGILGWLVGLPLPFIDYHQIIGATAGVGVIGPFLVGLLSAGLCVLGMACGIVALFRIRSGDRSGTGLSWSAIALGGSALTIYAAVVVHYMF
jgi:hypothetical protein